MKIEKTTAQKARFDFGRRLDQCGMQSPLPSLSVMPRDI
jgi:hypothetical protein